MRLFVYQLCVPNSGCNVLLLDEGDGKGNCKGNETAVPPTYGGGGSKLSVQCNSTPHTDCFLMREMIVRAIRAVPPTCSDNQSASSRTRRERVIHVATSVDNTQHTSMGSYTIERNPSAKKVTSVAMATMLLISMYQAVWSVRVRASGKGKQVSESRHQEAHNFTYSVFPTAGSPAGGSPGWETL